MEKIVWQDEEQYKLLYASKKEYGKDGHGKINIILDIIDNYYVKSMLDFGCGLNCTLIKAIKEVRDIEAYGYDFAATEETEYVSNRIIPKMVDLLVSTDCLEHVPKHELLMCWNIFNELSPKVMYHVICTRPAGQILPDGTNAHKTVEPADWWFNLIKENFPRYNVYNKSTDEIIKHQHAHFLLEFK